MQDIIITSSVNCTLEPRCYTQAIILKVAQIIDNVIKKNYFCPSKSTKIVIIL